MNLLLVTQKVDKDDPILGFFHRWIEEFSRHFSRVYVICLEEGRHSLPSNVYVSSLGKKKGSRSGPLARLYYSFCFLWLVWSLRSDYDAVFVHMNPVYIVLAGLFWKLYPKKIALWYTHRKVDIKLRLAERLSDVIFTAAKESFNIRSRKVVVTGHGIDVGRFAGQKRKKPIGTEPISILSVGRITPIKDCLTLIEAGNILCERWDKIFTIEFLGSPITAKDKDYLSDLRSEVSAYGLDRQILFSGHVNPSVMPSRYSESDITVNLSPTGGIDKVVLESMAAGVPAITCNEAFGSYEGVDEAPRLRLFRKGDAVDLAEKIISILSSPSLDRQLAKTEKEFVERFEKMVGVCGLVRTLSEKIKAL